MKICSFCRSSYTNTEEQCPNCEATEATIQCDNCGFMYKGTFCPNCGLSIHEELSPCPKCNYLSHERICPKCGNDTASTASLKDAATSLASSVSCKIVGHNWHGCKCTRCGETRNEHHTFRKTDGKCEQRCSVCGLTEELPHHWNGTTCSLCGATKGPIEGFWDAVGKRMPFLHVEKKKNRIIPMVVVILLISFLLLGIMAALVKPEQIVMPNVTGLNYAEAKAVLNDSNLSVIETVYEDGSKAWVIAETNWKVISQDPAPDTEVTRSDKITLTVENESEKEAERQADEAEKQAAAAKQKEEELEAQIASMVGQSYIDVYDKVAELGLTVSWLHETTGGDFSEEIRLNRENPDSEFGIPWIVVGVKDVDANKKTATLLINTQENRDRLAAADTAEEALSKKLDVYDAKLAVDAYGKNVYPYGFKLHYLAGVIAQTAEDENTWFLKITCDVTNEYGAKQKNLVCEARVSGTSDNPQVTYFLVY